MSIGLSSCKLLKFNVEDILALPRLKMGKFTKNIQRIDLKESFKEVIAIQKYQAEQRGVDMKGEVIGLRD